MACALYGISTATPTHLEAAAAAHVGGNMDQRKEAFSCRRLADGMLSLLEAFPLVRAARAQASALD